MASAAKPVSRRPGPTRRERLAEFSAIGHGAGTVVLIASMLTGAWVATYVAGGSHTAFPHAFYLPLLLAALRFGIPGALILTVITGIAAGPLMPLNVAAGTPQAMSNWVPRMVAFGVVSLMVAHYGQKSTPSISNRVEARRFRADLCEAIEAGAIRPAYQPIVDLTTGRLVGVEVLARWHTPQGTIPAAEFVVKAERWGCIDQLTNHMLQEACMQVASWRHGPLARFDWFTLAVNVSALDVGREDFAAEVKQVLRNSELPPSWLHLELTETALVDNIDMTIERLMNLRLLGVRLAVDDFGTGESSLAYLQRFPVDDLKIDRMFIDRIEHEHRSSALVQGIVSMGDAMHLKTVAEGIENPAQARMVRSFGTGYGQGYLFAPPLALDDIEVLLGALDLFEERNYFKLNPPAWARQEVLW